MYRPGRREEKEEPSETSADLLRVVAGYSFTYRRPYTLAYFKPAIFQHLSYTSTSNLHEPTIPALFRENFRCFYVGGGGGGEGGSFSRVEKAFPPLRPASD